MEVTASARILPRDAAHRVRDALDRCVLPTVRRVNQRTVRGETRYAMMSRAHEVERIRSMQEHRHAHHICDFRAVVVHVVEAVDVDAFAAAAADFNRHGGVAAVDHRHHLAGFAAAHQGGGEAAVVVGDELVEGGGGAGGAQGGGAVGGH